MHGYKNTLTYDLKGTTNYIDKTLIRNTDGIIRKDWYSFKIILHSTVNVTMTNNSEWNETIFI